MLESAVFSAQNPAENQTAKVLLSWQSPARVFMVKDEKYVRTVLLILLAIGLVLIFFKEFLLYAVFLALAFVSFVLRTVPPENMEHKVTEFGLISGNHSYLWKDLKDFWFVPKGGWVVLNINSNLRFPPRIFLLLPKEKTEATKAGLVAVLSQHLSYLQLPPENTVAKVADSLSQRFNLS